MALVSVIIPAYNAEKYIKKCLSSISAQVFDDIEVLVVDDCSGDATGQIVREHVAADSRFRYIALNINKGAMEARATGVRLSTGKFISFVDADDWVDRQMISCMVDRLEADASDIAICGVSYKDNLGFSTKNPFEFKKNQVILDVLPQFSSRKLGSAYLCNKLFRREVIFADASFDFGVRLHVGEDILVNFGAFARARSVSLLPEVLYTYRQTTSSATGSVTKEKAFVDLLYSYCLCCAHYTDFDNDVLGCVDAYFSVQFNFRCYQVANAHELLQYREKICAALQLLAYTRPEAIIYLMNVMKRNKRFYSVVSKVFRKRFFRD